MIEIDFENYDLFMMFSRSFLKHQDDWVRIFNGKLKIDELTNEKMKHVRTYYEYHDDSVISSLLFATMTMFPEHADKYSFIRDSLGEWDSMRERRDMRYLDHLIKKLISIIGSYQTGKVLMALHQESYAIKAMVSRLEIIPHVFGTGGVDGLALVVGENMYVDDERYSAFYQLFWKIMNDENEHNNDVKNLFKGNPLLLEDFLCEYHMFIRLFKPGYKGHEPYEIINLINSGENMYIILSGYKDSNLPYGEHQKQHIEYAINLTEKEIKNGTI